MRASFLTVCLFASLPWLAHAQSIEITGTGLEAGRFQVVATGDSDFVLILRRFDGDTLPKTTTTRVGMALGKAGVAVGLGEYLASGQPRGFFEVFGTDLASFEDDTDNDGIKDRTELQAAGFLEPMEPSDAATADVFDIVPDASVSNGIPGTGAGNIEGAHHVDIYRFDGVAGTGLFFDAVSHQSPLNLFPYQLIGPYGGVVASSKFGLSDMGPVNLPDTGEYVLVVGSSTDADTGTYSINITSIPAPQSFGISIGDVVAPDDPAPGAGTLEAAGAFDIYTFSGTAGQAVFYDTISQSGLTLVDIRMFDPSDGLVFSTGFGLSDVGTLELAESGTYRIEVGEATAANTGTYSFALTEVPPPDAFAINIGDTVSNGVPGPGAGSIEAPGAFDIYTFSGTAGQAVFFDTISQSGLTLVDIRMFDPSDGLVFSTGFGLSDVGTVELPATGTYRIEVGEANAANTGTYSFALTEVPPPDVFAIDIGDTISNGVPAAGAGNLETQGAFDHYTFAGTAGQKIFINTISHSGLNLVDIRLFDPSDTQIDSSAFGLSDIGTVELPTTGTYRVEVGETGNDNIGTYSLALTEVPPPDSFAISIGDTISNGSPGAGAGNIEVPGAYDIYTFSGTIGEFVDISTGPFAGVATVNYRLIDPSDNVLGNRAFNLTDIGVVELPATGTYTLEVGEADNQSTGTYEITVESHVP